MSAKKPTSVQNAVMKKINQGTVRMHPRAYFTTLAVVSVLAVIAAAISTAYLTSIVFFWFRIQTADTMAWGARANLSEAISTFPWWALALSLALLVAVTYLVKRHGRMYRHKTSTIILVILAVSLLIGFGLSFVDGNPTHTPTEPHSQQHGNGRQR